MGRRTKEQVGQINNRHTMLDTLYKKGVGYMVDEVVMEYASDKNGEELLKRKVTTKNIPPDIQALKSYMELVDGENELNYMTDVELDVQKNRLLNQLKSEDSDK